MLAAGAASVQSLTGIGFGLIIVPPLIFVIGAKEAVVVSNILGAVLSIGLLSRIHSGVHWRMALTLFAAAIVGMPLGLWLLLAVDARTLQIIIAVTVIVFTVLLARGLRLHMAGLAGDLFVGLASGVLRTSTSMSGPHVAGAAALLMSADETLKRDPDRVIDLLQQTAVSINSTQTCGGIPTTTIPNPVFGHGRIDVAAAYALLTQGTMFDDGFEDAAPTAEH